MKVFTIGHSNKTYESFLGLLELHGVNLVIDVRSAPVSKYVPHFNHDALEAKLQASGIDYEFMGDRLGGRPRGQEDFKPDGAPDYEKMAANEYFIEGLGIVERIAERSVPCLLCSEEDPADCHRSKLVSAEIAARGAVEVVHILGNGDTEAEADNAKRRVKAADKQLGLTF